MTTDEAARYHLYENARSVFDDAAADTLMTALPRDPDRFATKDDIAGLDAKIAIAKNARPSLETLWTCN